MARTGNGSVCRYVSYVLWAESRTVALGETIPLMRRVGGRSDSVTQSVVCINACSACNVAVGLVCGVQCQLTGHRDPLISHNALRCHKHGAPRDSVAERQGSTSRGQASDCAEVLTVGCLLRADTSCSGPRHFHFTPSYIIDWRWVFNVTQSFAGEFANCEVWLMASSRLSVRPSVRLPLLPTYEHLHPPPPLYGFERNFMLGGFIKICEKIQVLLEWDTNTRRFAWRSQYVF
jgi:hypothetical protein